LIADVLLDQRVAAGIGNIYKCESLFLERVDPRRRARELSRETLVALYATARRIMLENLGPGARTTRDRLSGDAPGDDRYFVYGRTNRPCRTCGRPIDCYQLGDQPRWTWSCASCQPLVGPGSEAGDGR
jgi:endonuclease-8